MTTPPTPDNLPKGPVEQPAAEAQPVTTTVTAAGENAYGVEQHGMFGVPGTGDTSGFGGLVREPWIPQEAERPYGGYFDEVVDAFRAAYSGASSAITATVIDRGELTLHIEATHIANVCKTFRDDPSLRFELLSSVSGVDYLHPETRLHAVYHLTSMTYRWRIRLEAATSVEDPHIPSVVAIYPTADWQEREMLRHVRHHLRRPPGADPDPDARRLGRLPAAQGLSARRDPGAVQGRDHSAARRTEGLPMSACAKWESGVALMAKNYSPSRPTTEGRVYTVTGGDWDAVIGGDPIADERIVLNMGPQHPSTHGVLRLVLELEGETVTDCRPVIGYLHTGIEKNIEFRTWTQGVTFLTRADYVAPFSNEAVYCLGVEKLLGDRGARTRAP